MCAELRDLDVNLTVEELRTRINNLTKRYRMEKNTIGSSGGCPSSWEYFAQINEFLGGYKCNNMSAMMQESLAIESGKFPNSSDYPLAIEVDIPAGSPSTASPSVSSQSTPSPMAAASAASATAKKKVNAIDSFVAASEKEGEMFLTLYKQSLENEAKVISLMEENNKMLSIILKK